MMAELSEVHTKQSHWCMLHFVISFKIYHFLQHPLVLLTSRLHLIIILMQNFNIKCSSITVKTLGVRIIFLCHNIRPCHSVFALI